MLSRQKISGALGGNVLETALGFLVIMFVTRRYPQGEAGVYFLVLAIVSILNNLKEGFLQNGWVKYLVENEFDLAVIRTGFFISFVGEGIKIMLFALLALIFPAIQSFLLYYAIYTLCFSSYRLLVFIHKSQLAMQRIVQGNLVILSVTVLGLLAMYFFSYAAEGILLVMGIAHFVALCSLPFNRMLLAQNLIRFYDRSLANKLVHFGKYGFLREVTGSIAHQAGIFISVYFLSLEATALLGLATRYTVLIAIPGSSLAGMLYPILLKHAGDGQSLVRVAQEGIGKMYALMIPIALLIVLGAPFFIYVLHGEEYLPAASVLALKVLAAVYLIPLGSGFSSLMNAINRPQEITQLMLISGLTTVALSLLLMHAMGLWGAAIAPMLTEVLGGWIIRRRLKTILQFDVLSIAKTTIGYWNYWIQKTKTLSWKKLKYQS